MNHVIFGRKIVAALAVLSAVSAVSLLAHAQLIPNRGNVLKKIGPLPDLVASVSVPAQIAQGATATVNIKLDNVFEPGLATKAGQPVSPGSPAVNGVAFRVLFAGYKVTSVQGASGFSCQPTGAGGTAPNTGVICTGGSIAAGASAAISISVAENGSPVHYCGPIYTDVLVDNAAAIAERSETNNRALGVTDTTTCIN